MNQNQHEINSATQLYCIFGNPVRHSLSPLIHNISFKDQGINALYMAFQPDNIKDAVSSMRHLGIAGASITIPFKVDVIKYIDAIDPLAEKIGSVNTLHNVNNRITGYNTDGYGAIKSLIDSGIVIKNSSFLIIGNGGSARSIAFTILGNMGNVYISGRNTDKINRLRDDLKVHENAIDSIPLQDIDYTFMENIDVIINTTPVGMHPVTNAMPLSEILIHNRHTVFDIVYAPEMTLLLETSLRKGCTIVKGLEMLINQGIKQFEIWTQKKAPAELIYNTLNKVLYTG